MQLVRDLGLLEGDGVSVVPPVEVTDEQLLTVHEPAYVAAVRAASTDQPLADLARGLGTDDVPCSRRCTTSPCASAGPLSRPRSRCTPGGRCTP